MDNAETVHVFERAGLGKAPFRFVGAVAQDIGHGVRYLDRSMNLTTKPGGTCAFCGQYILNMYDVESADGRRFHVGSDCILRTGSAGLIKAVNKAVAKLRREQRQARERANGAEMVALLADERVRATLATQSHPNAYRADKGESLLDWADWMAQHGGAKACASVLKMIKFWMARRAQVAS
jgi:hypothetical protein